MGKGIPELLGSKTAPTRPIDRLGTTRQFDYLLTHAPDEHARMLGATG